MPKVLQYIDIYIGLSIVLLACLHEAGRTITIVVNTCDMLNQLIITLFSVVAKKYFALSRSLFCYLTISFFLSLSFSFLLSLSVICLSLSIYLYLSFSLCLSSLYLSIYLSFCLSIYIFLFLSISVLHILLFHCYPHLCTHFVKISLSLSLSLSNSISLYLSLSLSLSLRFLSPPSTPCETFSLSLSLSNSQVKKSTQSFGKQVHRM